MPLNAGGLRPPPSGRRHLADLSDALAASSKPVFEDYQTNYDVEFEERDYLKWKNTYRDLLEDFITRLAASRERNEHIAQAYAQKRERYGKTIMFVDRWFQCEQIREFLRERGVRADTIYSRAQVEASTPEERYQRTADDNKRTLEAFRKGKLDVLLNVRMLTEGTDVPDVQTRREPLPPGATLCPERFRAARAALLPL